jgi:hypothetical protein
MVRHGIFSNMKPCCHCKEIKSFDLFGKNRSAKDGLSRECRKCMNERNAATRKKPAYIEWNINYQKKYRKQNKVKAAGYAAQYYIENKEEILSNGLKNLRNRLKKDPIFRATQSLRTRTRLALKGIVKSKNTMVLLGVPSVDFFREYIESLFQPGMTWDNYGLKGWHLDHIRPLSSFDLTTEEQQRIAFHYTNLQPLWAKDNLKKGNKYISPLEGENVI